MRAIEQPQLHVLEWFDVLDHFDAETLPARTASRKMILDNPLQEGFGSDRPCIGDAKRVTDAGAIVVGRGRHDTVHHARRESNLFLHEPLQGQGRATLRTPPAAASASHRWPAGCRRRGR
jgi:hypothetical protein